MKKKKTWKWNLISDKHIDITSQEIDDALTIYKAKGGKIKKLKPRLDDDYYPARIYGKRNSCTGSHFTQDV